MDNCSFVVNVREKIKNAHYITRAGDSAKTVREKTTTHGEPVKVSDETLPIPLTKTLPSSLCTAD